MTRHVALLRTLRSVGVAAALLAVVGCSDTGAPEPVTPDGWQRVESGALSFAVPGTWVEIDESNDPWTLAWATDAEIGADSVLIIGAPAFSDDGAGNALDLFMAGAQVAGWGYRSTGGSTPVDTDGLTVERNDFAYDDVHGVFWAASRVDSGAAVALQLTGRDLPTDLVDGIEGSIVLLDR